MKKIIWNSPKKLAVHVCFLLIGKCFNIIWNKKWFFCIVSLMDLCTITLEIFFVGSKTASQILDSMFFNPLLISNFWRNFTVIFSYDFIISFIVATIDLIITTYYRLDNQKPTDFAQEMEINTKWIQNIFPNILTKVFSGHFWSFQNIKSKMLIF